MPDTIRPSEAKAHISDLVTRVEAGEEFIVTRHGKPAARLVPVKPPKRRGGELNGPYWESFDRAKLEEIFAPMTNEELRAEGWEG